MERKGAHVSNVRESIDPRSRKALDEALAVSPGGLFNDPDLARRRANYSRDVALARASLPPDNRYTTDAFDIPGYDGDPPLSVQVFRPNTSSTSLLPGILYVHSGGMVFGSVDDEHVETAGVAVAAEAIVVSVEYRLAPENPYPAAVRDCVAAQRWMLESADALGIDPARTAIYGGSAGGGLALGTTLMVRDLGAHPVSFVMAAYPMIDDRNVTPSSWQITDIGVWDRDTNLEAWGWYLDGVQPDAYSSPTRATDLTGIPPTFIDVGDLDLFRDEAVEFAQRLMQHGVPTELHVYPGAYHGSEYIAPEASLSARIMAARFAALRCALE